VTIVAGHTVTVDVNAVADTLTINATGGLQFATNATPYTLNVGAHGIKNRGTFDATNAGAIVSAATTSTYQGLYNYAGAVFTAGAGAITLTSSSALSFENGGTFTGGTGLISAASFRNGDGSPSASLTVGAGGMLISTTGASFYPTAGSITLNGNLTLSGDFASGATTYSGAGKTILTDASHTINGSVKVHNLEIAPVTAARTITINGAVTATGTTQLNGVSGQLISFAGTGSIAAFTSSYCSTSNIASITCCNPGSPNSIGNGNWNTTATWSCSAVPVSTDLVTVKAGHTVTVDVNAVADTLTINATGRLQFVANATPYTLNVGAHGIKNSGTFDATNAGAIVSASTVAGNQGIYNYAGAVFTAGAGAITLTSSGALAFENAGTFTGGTGLISAASFRSVSASASLTVGAGGLLISTTGASFYPIAGTITLNGNLTLSGNVESGATTYSGTGKTILTDANHTITGPVNVHNLEIAPVTAARTITIPGAVTATGTTQLNGASGKLIAFAGTGSITAFASYYCSSSSIASITCNPKFNQTITFGVLPSKTAIDAPFPVSATASSNLAVSFAAAGNCTVLGSTVTITGVGSCTITASQAGDTNDYYAATDVPQTFSIAQANQTITQANQTINFAALPNKTPSEAPFTVTATASSGLPVSFSATGNCTVSGSTVTITGAGSCTITAAQAGDATYGAATSVSQTFTIASATPVTPATPPLPDQLSLFLQIEGTGHGKVTTDTGLSCQSSDCQIDTNTGELKCNPQACSQLIKTTTTVTLTPQADADSVFSSWGGNEDCVDGKVFMNSGYLCIAYFHRIYQLTVALQGAGQVMGYGTNQQPVIDCGTQCQTSVSDGMRISLQATPSQGMTFSGWSGDCQNTTQNPLPLEVTKEMKCLATFAAPTPVVTPTPVTVTPPVTVTTPPVVPTTPVVTPPVTTTPETTTAVATTPVVTTTATTGMVPSTSPTSTVTTATTTGNVPTTSPTPTATPVTTTGNVPTTSPIIPVTTSNVPTTTSNVPTTTTVETTPPPVVTTPTPVVTPAPVAVTPPPVITTLPVTIVGANYSCATTGNIGEVCNYGGREVTNLEVQGTGIVSNGLLKTTVVNTGWVSNFHITATGKLSGGVVTGYIVNEGIMRDFEFVGMSITGGTLGGVIRNNSRVGGYFQDVTLLPNTKITGGILSGIIKGDKNQPALLENVRVKGRSKLSGVKLGKNVKLEKGVVVEDK
jgi:hypothetical protein